MLAVFFFIGTYLVSLSDTKLGHILGYASDITIDKVVAYTNEERAKSGLGPVTYNPVLSDAARRKAADMFSAQYWAHTSPSGKEPWDFMREARYTYRVAGENLARDFMDTPSMISAWMASPTHRANIMNPRYSDIGIAVVNGTLHGTETTLVVQMFGDPVATVSQPVQAVAPAATAQPRAVEETISTSDREIPLETELPVEANQDQDSFVTVEFVDTMPAVPRQVLSTIAVPGGEIMVGPVISPNNLWKAFGIAVAILLVATLVYDGIIAHNRRVARIVGRNLAHIAIMLAVLFALIFFKSGVIS